MNSHQIFNHGYYLSLLSFSDSYCFAMILLQKCSYKNASSSRRFMERLTVTGVWEPRSNFLHMGGAITNNPSALPKLLEQTKKMSLDGSPRSVSIPFSPSNERGLLYWWYTVDLWELFQGHRLESKVLLRPSGWHMWLKQVWLLHKLLRFWWAGAEIYSSGRCLKVKPCM